MNSRILAVAFLLSLFSSGCTTPGMQMDVVAAGNERSRLFDRDDVEGRADIYAINAATIQRLADEQNANAPPSLPADRKFVRTSAPYQYIIGPEDILRITVWDHPELNNPGAITGSSQAPAGALATTATTILGTASTDSTSRVVNNDGTMFYPYVGTIMVAGKTVEDVRGFLAKSLASAIRNPQVEVTVASYRSKRAYITGDVKSPGALPITDLPIFITDAVSAAGGFNADADLSGAQFTHAGKTVPLDLYALFYKGELSSDLPILDGDVLNIPEQRYKKVFVLGEVIKPTSLPMPRGAYTLNEAITDAGGVSQITAQASHIYVIRGTPARPTIYHLDAQSADALIVADAFILQPRDIIFVDPAPIVRFSRVITQILPSLQALQAGKYLGQ